MPRVGIIGATGYAARELVTMLIRHPEVDLIRATSRTEMGNSLCGSHPHLLKKVEIELVEYQLDDFVSAGIECAFSCLPHAASAEIIKPILDNDIKVIDFSADYRLNDVSTFEKWYSVEHPDPRRVGNVTYGLPELFREQIKSSSLIANPGCFPTSAILPLSPLIENRLISTDGIIVDSKSGISGAGRSSRPHLHFPEANESVTAYSIGKHRHQPEMEQILKRKSGQDVSIAFTPHLIPMDRGILSTIYVRQSGSRAESEFRDCWKDYYCNELFIRIRDAAPTTKAVSGTNFCDIRVVQNGEFMIVISAIDNLIKGAAGAAVQNFNLIFGFPETTALH